MVTRALGQCNGYTGVAILVVKTRTGSDWLGITTSNFGGRSAERYSILYMSFMFQLTCILASGMFNRRDSSSRVKISGYLEREERTLNKQYFSLNQHTLIQSGTTRPLMLNTTILQKTVRLEMDITKYQLWEYKLGYHIIICLELFRISVQNTDFKVSRI